MSFDNICEYLWNQTDQINSILNQLGQQNSFSDISGTSNGELPSLDGNGMTMNPLMLFAMFLTAIWAALYYSSTSRNQITEKPRPSGGNDGGNGRDDELF